MEKDTVLEAMEKFRQSANYQEMVDEMNRREQEREKRVHSLFSRGAERRWKIIDWFIEKYESDEYINSEFAKGYEPRCEFFWFLYDYAQVYGTELFPDECYFPNVKYEIDGKYILQVIRGQGSIVRVRKKEDNEIVLYKPEEKETKKIF